MIVIVYIIIHQRPDTVPNPQPFLLQFLLTILRSRVQPVLYIHPWLILFQRVWLILPTLGFGQCYRRWHWRMLFLCRWPWPDTIVYYRWYDLVLLLPDQLILHLCQPVPQQFILLQLFLNRHDNTLPNRLYFDGFGIGALLELFNLQYIYHFGYNLL